MKAKQIWLTVLAFATAVALVGGCYSELGSKSTSSDGFHKCVGAECEGEGGGYHHCVGAECTADGGGGSDNTTTSTTSTNTTTTTSTTTHTTTSTTTTTSVVEDECVSQATCVHMSVNDVCSTNPGGCTDILACGSDHVWKLLEADVDCGAGGSGGGSTGSTSSSTSTTSSSTTTTTGPVVKTMVVDFIPLDQTVTHTFVVGGVPNGTVVTKFGVDGQGKAKWVSLSFPLAEGQKAEMIYVFVDGAYYSCGGPEPINPANHFTGIVRASWGGVAVEPRMVGNGGSGCNIGVTASDAGWSHVESCDQLDSAKYVGQLETVGDNVDYNCNGNVGL